MADKAALAGSLKRAQNAGIMDLLVTVELAPSRIAGRMNVTDQMAMLMDAADQVAVHHLHPIQSNNNFTFERPTRSIIAAQ